MLENSYNEIYLVNAQTLFFEYTNNGACQNLGYTLEEMKKFTPCDIKPQYDKETFKKLINPLLEGKKEKIIFYCEHKRADNSRYPVEIHMQVMREEDQTNLLIVAIDITEQKKNRNGLESICRRLQAESVISGSKG